MIKEAFRSFLFLRAALAQEIEQSSTNRKVGGFIPGFPSPTFEVSLGKTPKFILPLMRSPVGECV